MFSSSNFETVKMHISFYTVSFLERNANTFQKQVLSFSRRQEAGAGS